MKSSRQPRPPSLEISVSLFICTLFIQSLFVLTKNKKKRCESLWDVFRNQCFRFFGKRTWQPARGSITLGGLCHFAFAICAAVLLHMGDVQSSRVCVCFLWRNVLVKDLNETSTPERHLRGPALISTQFHPAFQMNQKKKFPKGHPDTKYSIRAHFRVSIEFCSFTWIRTDFYSSAVCWGIGGSVPAVEGRVWE